MQVVPLRAVNILPIIVIGAGSWGTALALTLARNGSPVRLWGHSIEHQKDLELNRENRTFLPGFKFPDNIEIVYELAKAFQGYSLSGYQDILIVVPSRAFTEILNAIKPFLQKNSRILCASKGLTAKGELLQEAFMNLVAPDFPSVPFGLLSGPSFATEVAANLPTAVSCATSEPAFTQAMQQRFHSQYFRVYRSLDIIGLELGGIIKNVLAIAVGIADGLNLGANARSALITRGLAELKALYLAEGASLDTLLGLAGVGDMILTCTDNQSRNRRFGLALAKGLDPLAAEQSIGQTVEGKRCARIMLERFTRHNIACPICEQVAKIIDQTVSPREAVLNLMERPSRSEM